jgi:hypothetical protein
MKKICIALFMVAALAVSLSTYSQDNKKESACCKAKTEQAEKKSGCCAKKKEKACCAKKVKSSTCKDTAATETKSCGKKK